MKYLTVLSLALVALFATVQSIPTGDFQLGEDELLGEPIEQLVDLDQGNIRYLIYYIISCEYVVKFVSLFQITFTVTFYVYSFIEL